MMTVSPIRFAHAMLLSLTLAGTAVAKDASVPVLSGGPVAISRLSLRDRFRSVRVAPGGPAEITDASLERLKKAGYNTIFISDITRRDGAKWIRLSPDQIRQRLSLAREHDISVIVLCVLAEPILDDVSSQAVRKTASAAPSLVEWSAAVHPNAVRSLDEPRMRLRYLTAEEVLAVLRPWQTYDQGEVIAFTPLGDDAFYMGVPAEKQMEWAQLAAIATPRIPMMGLIGEFALSQPLEYARQFWAPSAYAYIALIMYPYSLGALWGHPLNHVTSANPDADLAAYVHDYVSEQTTRFLFELKPQQTVIPVIQTFNYRGDDPGIVPRTRDIALQARLVHYELQVMLGQEDNYAMAYFFLGSEDKSELLKGIEDMPGWPEVVSQENAVLEKAFRFNLHSASPRPRGAQ
jgi:hypothetical protein